MTALASPFGAIRQFESPFGLKCGQSRIGVTYQKGSLVAHRRGSKLFEIPLQASPRADLIFVGAFQGNEEFAAGTSDDGDRGALDTNGNPQLVSAHPGGIGWFDTGTGVNEITADDINLPCFGYNDNTLYKTDLGGTLSFVGIVYDVSDSGKVKVYVDSVSGLPGLYGDPIEPIGDVDPVLRARGVVLANVSDLAAFTVADNGLTYENDDIILLTAQTTAAQCGLYVVGTVASGAAPLTRYYGMAAGMVCKPGTIVEIGAGNTEYANSTWKATRTSNATIGTHDPVFYPRTYKQTVTLAAGTYTIGTGSTATPDEALFLLAGASVQCTRNTAGGTLTGTVMYVAPAANRTAGKPGTAAMIVRSAVEAGTIQNQDTSTVDVEATNW